MITALKIEKLKYLKVTYSATGLFYIQINIMMSPVNVSGCKRSIKFQKKTTIGPNIDLRWAVVGLLLNSHDCNLLSIYLLKSPLATIIHIF